MTNADWNGRANGRRYRQARELADKATIRRIRLWGQNPRKCWRMPALVQRTRCWAAFPNCCLLFSRINTYDSAFIRFSKDVFCSYQQLHVINQYTDQGTEREQRKPKLSMAAEGLVEMRMEECRLEPSWFHEPPRSTRLFPVDGPTGFDVGETL